MLNYAIISSFFMKGYSFINCLTQMEHIRDPPHILPYSNTAKRKR